MRILIIFLFFTSFSFSQTNTYSISFKNAVHHEAQIKVSFPDLEEEILSVRMSRTSPGRYALHEFAKNVYAVKATNSNGEELRISRPDPYSWDISGHDGTVNLEYTLFANRGDGTYSQIDETHAHLNIPATFMYAEDLKQRPVQITFNTENHPHWKVATQLKHLEGNTYLAPDLYYFMDSPTEISNHDLRQFTLNGQDIKFALHHTGTEAEFDEYFDQVEGIVEQQMKVFGELPEFDYGEYIFLACYMPQVSGDGMEHRNSTILTSTRSLDEGGMERNIGTVAHEFFHAWNVERLRPESLEPFDFTEANMTGALWFAEGFTSYYTPLTLVRAGITNHDEFVKSLNGTFNYVWTSPARQFFNPIEMSYQAPFVDAATSVDPVNRENTFISYYSYGSMLGLALDLKLREQGLNLDDYMKLLWEIYGKPEIPYSIRNLEKVLVEYAGRELAMNYFNNYIYNSKKPDYKDLFRTVGLKLEKASEDAYFGAGVRSDDNGLLIRGNPFKDAPAYKAGLASGDRIIAVNGIELNSTGEWQSELEKFSPGDGIEVVIERYGERMIKTVLLEEDPAYTISIDENASVDEVKARKAWISAK